MKEAAGGEEVIFASHHKAASKLFCGLLGFPRAQWLPKKFLFRLRVPRGTHTIGLFPFLAHTGSAHHTAGPRLHNLVVQLARQGPDSIAGDPAPQQRGISTILHRPPPRGVGAKSIRWHARAGGGRARKSVMPAFIHQARRRARARGRPCPRHMRGERRERKEEGRGARAGFGRRGSAGTATGSAAAARARPPPPP